MFDPEAVGRPLTLPEGKAGFNFLTNGKWEPRKGWDVLLRAYWEEFSGTGEDVALFFNTRLGILSRKEFLEFRHNISEEVPSPLPLPSPSNSKILFFLRSVFQLGISVEALPRVTFLKETVPFSLMPALYKVSCNPSRSSTQPTLFSVIVAVPFLLQSVDAFVLATHGEGWGLPIMEAMAMELPTIATFWGGELLSCLSAALLVVLISWTCRQHPVHEQRKFVGD